MIDNKHKKLPRQEYGSDVESDDDTLDQIYGFADFSEHASKMKINKWLSKSQDDEDEINHIDSNYYLAGSQNNSLRRLKRTGNVQTDDFVYDKYLILIYSSNGCPLKIENILKIG